MMAGVAWVYPALLEDDDGTVLVSFRDVPEAHTFGVDAADALRHASDALLTALAGYMTALRDLPSPSPVKKGEYEVVVPMVDAAKLELYDAMRSRNWRKADLAKALKVYPAQIDRLLDLRHASTFDQLQRALTALNRTLIVRGVGMRPVPLPRRIAPGATRARVASKHVKSLTRLGQGKSR